MPETVGNLMQKMSGPRPMGGMQMPAAVGQAPMPGLAMGMSGTPQMPKMMQGQAVAAGQPSGMGMMAQGQPQPQPWSKGEERAAWRTKVQDIRKQREAGVKRPGREFWAGGGKVKQPGSDSSGQALDMSAKRAGLRATMAL